MCYHVSFDVRLQSITDVFSDLVVDSNMELVFPTSSYINGFDHKEHPIMYFNKEDGKKHLQQMMWGYLPQHVRSWERALKFWNGYTNDSGKFVPGYITLNAIGEEILDKNKMWRDAALNRRCIMFTDGFYEWRHVFPLNKKNGAASKDGYKISLSHLFERK